jgi:hypothetical protein
LLAEEPLVVIQGDHPRLRVIVCVCSPSSEQSVLSYESIFSVLNLQAEPISLFQRWPDIIHQASAHRKRMAAYHSICTK